MRKVTVACFSPSGGTRHAARVLADCLGGEQIWLDLIDPQQRSVQMEAEELLVLALPVYAGRTPAVDRLLDGLRGSGTPCVLLAAYGNRHYDEALAQMKQKMNAQGFVCAGAAAVVTPHIFAPALGMGRPHEEDRVQLKQLARQVAAKLETGCVSEVTVPGNPNPEPKPAVPVPKSRDMERCVRCGLCAKRCPAGAMDASTLEWDADRCISCMSCVCSCPVGALSFDCRLLTQRLKENFSKPRSVEVFF